MGRAEDSGPAAPARPRRPAPAARPGRRCRRSMPSNLYDAVNRIDGHSGATRQPGVPSRSAWDDRRVATPASKTRWRVYDPARGYPAAVPYLLYRDPGAAARWITEILGFSEAIRFTVPDGGPAGHIELARDGAVLMLGLAGGRF